jgi:hypothetical protein
MEEASSVAIPIQIADNLSGNRTSEAIVTTPVLNMIVFVVTFLITPKDRS